MLTAEQLRKLLHYNPETGVFTRMENSTRPDLIGTEAGCVSKTLGYVLISVNCKTYYAHRLAVLWMTGKWPSSQVDHKNLIRNDNSWNNLRLATKKTNGMNRDRPSNNTSGYKGVSWYKPYAKWRAYINVDGKQRGLGYFSDIEEARAAYAKAAELHHKDFKRAA